MDTDLCVYIDEGGDPGIRDGLAHAETRYEWFSIGAIVVRKSRTRDVVDWVKEIKSACNSYQTSDLHYVKLNQDRRVQACRLLARLPVRAFCLLSHKSNLRQHVSAKLGKMKPNEYTNWCTRLLLERVMHWAENFYLNQNCESKPLDLIFSENRGHNYTAMFSYFETLNMQARSGGFKLKAKAWNPEMMDRNCWKVIPHEKNAGVQLADVVASAFLQSANFQSPTFNQDAAEALAPIMARDVKGLICNNGVTGWPLPSQGQLPAKARSIFEFYGYEF